MSLTSSSRPAPDRAGDPGGAPEAARAAARASHPSSTPRRAAWPLWGAVAGLTGFVGTVVTDLRPPAEMAASDAGVPYTATPADMLTLDVATGRIGWSAGVVCVIALLVLQAAWRARVEPRTGTIAARLVSGGLLATAAGATLGYGWRGALANYLGPEAGMYDEQGLWVYYLLTDFGAYLPWLGVLVSALAVAWSGLVDRTMSRALGVVSAMIGLGLLVAMFVTGVPGLPGTLGQLWLFLAGVWWAVTGGPLTRR